MAQKSVKYSATMNEELLRKVDEFAEKNYMNRSSVISYACNQFLLSYEVKDLLRSINALLHKFSESGSLSDADKEELEKLDLVYRTIVSTPENGAF